MSKEIENVSVVFAGQVSWGTGDTRVLRNRIKLVGGVFSGSLETDRCVPDGYVVSIAVQEFREGNGAQRIQRSSYLCVAGHGKML